MTVQVKGYQTPKNGSTSQECQDALAWDERKGIFAIADGVSDSAFQNLWANLLVKSFVAKAPASQNFTKDWLATWLQAEQNEWHSRVNWDEIPWHGRLKAQQTGGQATFLGIRLLPERRSWVGVAMGDCNLFRFGKDRTFKQSIPNQRSADFSNATQAFSSISQNPEQMLSQVKMIQGTYEPGDYLVLATDAVARWMLEGLEAKRDPLDEIPASHEPDAFNRWVRAQRQDGRIKDDDTSLLVIQPEPVQIPVRPLPPLRPRAATRVWTYVYLIGLLLFTIAGFLLGTAWQNWQSSRRLERDVQTPLLAWVQRLELNQQPSRREIQKGLLEIIVAAQPRTKTGQAAKNALCVLFPTEFGCGLTPTPQQGPQPSP